MVDKRDTDVELAILLDNTEPMPDLLFAEGVNAGPTAFDGQTSSTSKR